MLYYGDIQSIVSDKFNIPHLIANNVSALSQIQSLSRPNLYNI